MDACVNSFKSFDMSAAVAMAVSGNEIPAPTASPAAAKEFFQKKKALRPKIDLDDGIRWANDMSAMSRKMLEAAMNGSRNIRKANRRLIKKARKPPPEISRGSLDAGECFACTEAR